MSTTRTITLTGRPSVKISEDDWPIVASVSERDWDGEHRCQANITWDWWIMVRQHTDGRVVVYGGYDFSTEYQGDRDYRARAGVYLDQPGTICQAIRDVCRELASAESDSDYTARWRTMAARCIADLPAEEI